LADSKKDFCYQVLIAQTIRCGPIKTRTGLFIRVVENVYRLSKFFHWQILEEILQINVTKSYHLIPSMLLY